MPSFTRHEIPKMEAGIISTMAEAQFNYDPADTDQIYIFLENSPALDDPAGSEYERITPP